MKITIHPISERDLTMNHSFELLTEMDAMWAELLLEVLKNNNIPCTSLPIYGAGMTLRGGKLERLQIFVPQGEKEKALEILDVFELNEKN